MISLPLLSALFVIFSLALYVLLDGFDLGVGTLLLFQPNEAVRDRMVASITPTWDGNETWLIMAGVALLAGFPIAYGILLPAFYLPLIVMLLSLGLRGVSFEFRIQPGAGKPWWDRAFGVGSTIAIVMQGMVVGGLLQGVAVRDQWFSGTVWDVFSPFSVLSAAALIVGYAALGAGWLCFKGSGEMYDFGCKALRRTLPLCVLLFAAVCAVARCLQPGVAGAWQRTPTLLLLTIAIFLAAAGFAWMRMNRERDGAVFVALLAMIAAGIVGLGLTLFPDVVPFRLSLWQAASASSSQVFLLIGAAVVTPVVLGYSAYAYWVFRGKTPSAGWEA
jgi:cytochrome bd ubiquinol oxidase subunit II